jgi:hypothetical protein
MLKKKDNNDLREMRTKYRPEKLKERENLKDPGNIGMGLKKIRWERVDWIYLARDRD